MKTALVGSLGCKLNQAESEDLARQLAAAGFSIVHDPQQADLCVLLTCTVTHIADRKARQRLRWLRRRNPAACIVAAGCYARRAPQEIERLGIGALVDCAGEQLREVMQATRGDAAGVTGPGEGGFRTRAMVKVQEGCDDRCSFCVVPTARGQEHSVPARQVLEAVKERVAEGYREVVLTGTKVGDYSGDGGLVGLLRSILDETEVERLRVSSLQPQEISPQLLDLWSDERLCRHFHIALQSGSEAVLRRMRRRYSAAGFARAVREVRRRVPDVAVTTDVLAGFPGESDEEFGEGLSFCESIGFAALHVFPYSARSGTEAAEMPCQVDERKKRERVERLLALSAASAIRFGEGFAGRIMPVLWEGEVGPGLWSGLTGNYLRVLAAGPATLAGRILPARLLEVRGGGVRGEVLWENMSKSCGECDHILGRM